MTVFCVRVAIFPLLDLGSKSPTAARVNVPPPLSESLESGLNNFVTATPPAGASIVKLSAVVVIGLSGSELLKASFCAAAVFKVAIFEPA